MLIKPQIQIVLYDERFKLPLISVVLVGGVYFNRSYLNFNIYYHIYRRIFPYYYVILV